MGEAPRNSNSGETSPLWGRDVGRSSVIELEALQVGGGQPARIGSGRRAEPEPGWGPGVNTPPSVSPQPLSSCCDLLLTASIQQARDTWGLKLQKSLLPNTEEQ